MAAAPLFQGSATALVTPFHDGKVDVTALRRLVRFQTENGTAALVVCGTTGEPTTMTLDERKLVISETVEAAEGRVPVICGTGSNSTQSVIEAEKCFRGCGCAAQLIVTPYYNKTTQEGLYAHFMAIADQTVLPIIIYNVPSRTNLDIAPETLERLVGCGRFIAIKESCYDLPRVMEKLSAVGDKMTFYSGNDDMVLPMLGLGAMGVISVAANLLPKQMSEMTRLYFEGDQTAAVRWQLRLMPLIRALFAEVNPIPVKYAMTLMGLCGGELRLPLVEAGQSVQQALKTALTTLGAL